MTPLWVPGRAAGGLGEEEAGVALAVWAQRRGTGWETAGLDGLGEPGGTGGACADCKKDKMWTKAPPLAPGEETVER